MPSPLVTVIVTSYNQQDFIGPALESIASQDYPTIEILACDDASTDDTATVLEQWAKRDPRIRVLRADSNGGLSENRNRGLRVCNGEYIALLDGDDLMRPGKIAAQVRALEANATAAGCVHDAEIFQSEDGKKLGLTSQSAGPRGLREGGVELWLNPTYAVLPSTMMFRASCVPEHLFDTRLPFTADWLFSVELFRRGKCVVVDDIYVDYRRHHAQMTTESAQKGFEEALMIMGIVDARYPELKGHTRTMRAALLLGEARRRVRAGEYRTALQYARAAWYGGGVEGHIRLAILVCASRWRGPTIRVPAPRLDQALGARLSERADLTKQFEEQMMATGIVDARHPERARSTKRLRAELLSQERARRVLCEGHGPGRAVSSRRLQGAAKGHDDR